MCIVLHVVDVLHQLEPYPREVRHPEVVVVWVLKPDWVVVGLPCQLQQPFFSRKYLWGPARRCKDDGEGDSEGATGNEEAAANIAVCVCSSRTGYELQTCALIVPAAHTASNGDATPKRLRRCRLRRDFYRYPSHLAPRPVPHQASRATIMPLPNPHTSSPARGCFVFLRLSDSPRRCLNAEQGPVFFVFSSDGPRVRSRCIPGGSASGRAIVGGPSWCLPIPLVVRKRDLLLEVDKAYLVGIGRSSMHGRHGICGVRQYGVENCSTAYRDIATRRSAVLFTRAATIATATTPKQSPREMRDATEIPNTLAASCGKQSGKSFDTHTGNKKYC